MQNYILIIGACGQIGTELTLALRSKYGSENIIASDIREGSESLMASGPFEILDATDYDALEEVIAYYEINVESVGANITLTSLMLMCAAFVIPV